MKTQCGNVTGNLLLLSKYKHNNAGPVPNAIKVLAISHPQEIRQKILLGLDQPRNLRTCECPICRSLGAKKPLPNGFLAIAY